VSTISIDLNLTTSLAILNTASPNHISGWSDVPYADSGGIRIYYEVIGKGQPLELHHGFTLDHASWSDASKEWDWAGALKDDFTLILMDSRGHGASDKPHDPQEYQGMKQASDFIAVLDDLGLDKAHFLGYSMGGGIGFVLACYMPQRFHSFVLGGASAEDSDEPNPLIPIFEQGPEAVIALFEGSMNGPLPSNWRGALLANDYEALIACAEFNDRMGLEAILHSVKAPCLIFAGDEDASFKGAKRASELIPNATFISLHGGHMAPYMPLVLPHVRKFLKRAGREEK
jgi:pimeloyl-ACP methyl ester carboxylesterase